VPRPRRRERQTVSLFPFLTILACVIGVLTLMITALALGQMNTRSKDEAIARAEAWLALGKRLKTARAKASDLADRIAQAESRQSSLARALRAARAERDRLQKRLAEGRDLQAALAELLAKAKGLEQRIKDLEAQLAERRRLIQPLEQQLKDRKNVPESEVVIRPGGTGKAANMNPTFVEVAATGIVIRDGEKQHRVTAADIGKDDAFTKVCEQVAKDRDGIIIFLIRSDGYGTWGRARGIARRRGALTGKLPVIGQGHIDLRLFE